LNWRSSRTIDIAILSHPHKDQVHNFPELAKKMEGEDGGLERVELLVGDHL
jgi:beta-lactamase superfamily II metal-dependent hydrolase